MLKLLLAYAVAVCGSAHAATETEALRVLTDNCEDCHGPDSSGLGGIDFITDLERVVGNGLVVPGKPDQSLIFQRITARDASVRMPAGGSPLASAEVRAIRAWIEAGAPTGATQPRIPPLSTLLTDAVNDARGLSPAARATARYVNLAPWASRPLELQALKNTLAMALNSLSWERDVMRPEPVGTTGLLLRIDVAALGWTAPQWDDLTADFPYEDVRAATDATALATLVDARFPLVRADWLIYTATRPPFYHVLAQIPEREQELTARLGLDLKRDIEATTSTNRLVARAAFVRSGVSNFNRVIERQTGEGGYYWRSYDFSSSSGRRYAIAFPLGPAPTFGELPATRESLGFTHDGGEVIFRLPNGMQAFMLIDAQGNRLNEGPANIVFDRDRGRPITNGVSCMGCHVKGLIDKADEVRAFAEQSATLSRDAIARIKDLYPPTAETAARLAADRTTYQDALVRLAVERGVEPKPATFVEDEYQASVDMNKALRELDLAAASDLAGITERMSSEAAGLIAPLFSGQPVPRDVFAGVYREISRALARLPVDQEVAFRRTGLGQRLTPGELRAVPIGFGRSGEVQRLAMNVELGKAANLAPGDVALILRDDSGREARLSLDARTTRDGEVLKISVPTTASEWRALIGAPVQGAWTVLIRLAQAAPQGVTLETLDIQLGFR